MPALTQKPRHALYNRLESSKPFVQLAHKFVMIFSLGKRPEEIRSMGYGSYGELLTHLSVPSSIMKRRTYGYDGSYDERMMMFEHFVIRTSEADVKLRFLVALGLL